MTYLIRIYWLKKYTSTRRINIRDLVIACAPVSNRVSWETSLASRFEHLISTITRCPAQSAALPSDNFTVQLPEFYFAMGATSGGSSLVSRTVFRGTTVAFQRRYISLSGTRLLWNGLVRNVSVLANLRLVRLDFNGAEYVIQWNLDYLI